MINCKDCRHFKRLYLLDEENGKFSVPAVSGKCKLLFSILQLTNDLTFFNCRASNNDESVMFEVNERFGCMAGKQKEK